MTQTVPDVVQQPARELDSRLLTGAQARDVSAQQALVLLYQQRVMALCTRMLGSRTLALDVCQETFLRVLSRLARFQAAGPARLSTWILTIASRLCIDEMRRQKRQAARQVVLTDDSMQSAELTDAHALRRALDARLQHALLSLPEELRVTFVLRVTGEFSVQQTAVALGVDEGTVKSRLSRARARLRETIGEV